VPGTTVVLPSVMVTARSACGVTVSPSVKLSLVGVGSVVPAGALTVKVVVSVPVALGLITMRNVVNALWPLARLSPLHVKF